MTKDTTDTTTAMTTAMTIDTTDAKRALKNARRREQRREKRWQANRELEAVRELSLQLIAAGDDPLDLRWAQVTRDGAVLVGQPEHTVLVLVLGDEMGWHATQYQSADFACRSARALHELAPEWELDDQPYCAATVDQRERVIRSVLAGDGE